MTHGLNRSKDSQTSLQSDLETPVDDTRVLGYDPLLPPQILQLESPLGNEAKHVVASARRRAARILNGQDDRLLIIVGPCSIHDTNAALEYGISNRFFSKISRSKIKRIGCQIV